MEKSTSQLIYSIRRRFAGKLKKLERDRGKLYGIAEPGDSRTQESRAAAKKAVESRRHPAGNGGEINLADLIAEIEGAGTGGSIEIGRLREWAKLGVEGLRFGSGSGLSNLSAADQKRAIQKSRE